MKYQRESLKTIIPEIMALVKAHWEEYKSLGIDGYEGEFNIDLDRYLHYNEIGYHRLYTARKDGEVVGYAGMYVNESMHTQLPIATEDTWFLQEEHRKGFNALRFLKFVEEDLKSIGIREIHMTAQLANKSGRIMEARGYVHTSNNYMKVI